MKEHKKNYQKFLKSDFWLGLSAEAKRRDGCCVRCGWDKLLQAHHKHYRSDWYATQLEDLETLCGICHTIEHGEWTYCFVASECELLICEFKRLLNRGIYPTREDVARLSSMSPTEEEKREIKFIQMVAESVAA